MYTQIYIRFFKHRFNLENLYIKFLIFEWNYHYKTKLPYIKFSKCFFFFKFNNKIWKLQKTNFHFSVFEKFFFFYSFIYFCMTHILWTIYDFQDILFLHEKWKPQAINFHFLSLFFDLFSFSFLLLLFFNPTV